MRTIWPSTATLRPHYYIAVKFASHKLKAFHTFAVQNDIYMPHTDPYETDVGKVPDTDQYKEDKHFGRYLPQPSDFRPDETQCDSPAYWNSVLELCTPPTLLYEGDDGERDIFAVGSVIIKSGHLKNQRRVPRLDRDYSLSDKNDARSIALAQEVLRQIDVQVPHIYYQGLIQDQPVLIQSRLPGVALCVAWPYLSQNQKVSFMEEVRYIMRHLYSSISPFSPGPSYTEPDDDPVRHRAIQDLEFRLLFSEREGTDEDFGFVHNDTQGSNIIVDRDRVVGIVDWEMAGYFGWKAAADVHVHVRSPKRADFANANVDEERLSDILFWSHLYE